VDIERVRFSYNIEYATQFIIILNNVHIEPSLTVDNDNVCKGRKRTWARNAANIWFICMAFHDFPDLENLNFKSHDFPGSVRTLWTVHLSNYTATDWLHSIKYIQGRSQEFAKEGVDKRGVSGGQGRSPPVESSVRSRWEFGCFAPRNRRQMLINFQLRWGGGHAPFGCHWMYIQLSYNYNTQSN